MKKLVKLMIIFGVACLFLSLDIVPHMFGRKVLRDMVG
jgi:hypothetical protein